MKAQYRGPCHACHARHHDQAGTRHIAHTHARFRDSVQDSTARRNQLIDSCKQRQTTSKPAQSRHLTRADRSVDGVGQCAWAGQDIDLCLSPGADRLGATTTARVLNGGLNVTRPAAMRVLGLRLLRELYGAVVLECHFSGLGWCDVLGTLIHRSSINLAACSTPPSTPDFVHLMLMGNTTT